MSCSKTRGMYKRGSIGIHHPRHDSTGKGYLTSVRYCAATIFVDNGVGCHTYIYKSPLLHNGSQGSTQKICSNKQH